MPRKPCAASGCFVLVDLGEAYCPRHAEQDKRERALSTDGKRRKIKASRKWYSKAAWRGPNGRRLQQLKSEPLCRMCPDNSKRPATVADHVKPHREDHGLFWFGELQSLCKPCHDIKKQRIEARASGGRGVRKTKAHQTETGGSNQIFSRLDL